MSDLRTFLEKVVPWPTPGQGYINLHDHLPGERFRGVAVESVDAFLAALDKARAKERNLYLCISQQAKAKPNGAGLYALRHQVDATFLKSVCYDIDAGPDKPYKDTKEVLAALAKFLNVTGIVKPSALVASGSGGVHCWWVSDRPLIPGVWQQYAEYLHNLAAQHGLEIDPVCTTDSARVFRVPETLNYKHNPPRPVKLLGMGQEYDFAAVFKAALAPGASAPTPGGYQVPARYRGQKVALLGVGAAEPPPLALAADVIPLCPFLLNTLRTGGDGRPEPQWREALRCAAAMEDGEKLAHKFSEGDKRYSVGETNRKFDETLNSKEKYGWPTCAAIEKAGAPECKTCPHRARDLSPFKLQRTIAKESGGVIVATKTGPWWNALPAGFFFDEKTKLIMHHMVPPKKKKGGGDNDNGDDNDDDDFDVPLFKTPIIGKPYVTNNPVGIHFKVQLDKSLTFDSFIPRADFTRSKIMAALFRENITPNSKLSPAKFEDFMGTFVERMNSYIDTTEKEKPTPYGWLERDGANDDDLPVGFSYGGVLFTNDGKKMPIPFTDDLLREQYRPCGKEERWHEASKLILGLNSPELEIILAASFAAPLMRLAGQSGAMLVVYSNASGAFKSTASKIAAAVWGNPIKTREVHGSTWKGSVKRLGVTKNLLAQWDDMQEKKEIMALADTGLTLCQGNEGTKLQSDREFHETGDWRTLCLACMNQSFVAWLVQNTQTPVARIARVFEVKYEKKLGEGVINTLDADRIVAALERNYGQVGMKYAELLANNAREIKAIVKQENDAFLATLGPVANTDNAKTRFWLCACTTLLAGTRLANEMGIGLHYDLIKARLLKAFYENYQYDKEEATEHGTKENTQNVIARVLRHVGDVNTLWTQEANDGLKKGDTPIDVHILDQPRHGAVIDCHVVTSLREIRISKSALSDWCQKNNASFQALQKGLRTHFGVDDKRHRITLAAGTGYARMRQDAVVIPVPEGSIFEEFLFAHGGRADEQIK